MSTKDEFIFKKSALMSTKSGKDILKHIVLQERGYKQFHKYTQNNDQAFRDFTKRYLLSLHTQVISDPNPVATLNKFVEEIGSPELALEESRVDEVKARISKPEVLADRVERLLNSNFVVMTFPVLHALFDGASQYQKETIPNDVKNAVIDGHIIAIDLSEPMDRIMDKDEDLNYLDDYKLMNPYILEIARQKISQGGESISKAFEEGFKDARIGQYIDTKLKARPESISDENMIGCYKKYRAVMGTAGRNMALNRRPLADIFHLGMAKAGESVGCGNEIQDAIKNGRIKIPSWPLFYSLLSGDVRPGFELTIKKGRNYLDDAKIALAMLPEDFQQKPYMEFLFLTVSHYNEYWYNELKRRDLFALLQKNLNGTVKMDNSV